MNWRLQVLELEKFFIINTYKKHCFCVLYPSTPHPLPTVAQKDWFHKCLKGLQNLPEELAPKLVTCTHNF